MTNLFTRHFLRYSANIFLVECTLQWIIFCILCIEHAKVCVRQMTMVSLKTLLIDIYNLYKEFICIFITLSSNAAFLVYVMITTKFLSPVEGLYNFLPCRTNALQSPLTLAQTNTAAHFFPGYGFPTLENKLFVVVISKCVAKLSEHVQISIRFLESNSSPIS